MKIIRQQDQSLTTWSGGTTRQVYIFPEGSSYTDRNFQIRISTATVEVETSVFTSLPGYFRRLMVLEGELHLIHQGQHESHLKKFDEDSFMGEWKTVSYGKATDFNAMSTEQYATMLSGYEVEPSKEILDYSEVPVYQAGFYIYKGTFKVISGNDTLTLAQGDFMLLEAYECKGTIQMENEKPAELVRVMVEKLF